MATNPVTTEECAKKWSKESLTAARKRADADPKVDDMAASLFRPPPPGAQQFGTMKFNFLLGLINKILEAPELLLINDSLLRQLLATTPSEFVDYFDPVEAPDWVDEDKLEIAANLWKSDSLPLLVTLISASLPACYLMKKGIPALYQSQKLVDPHYLMQRVFETGLMLDAVMDPNGLQVVSDVGLDTQSCRREAYKRLDPSGQWDIVGADWHPTNPPGKVMQPGEVDAEMNKIRAEQMVPRYIWGRGLISTKKVRFLHASMRYLLRNPPPPPPPGAYETAPSNPFSRPKPWDEADGAPVNQEDLAFTLLTFGVLMPRGLEKIGRTVTREQKEAFLHLWKLVGTILGIEEGLMSDNLDEAEYLYDTIKGLEEGGSEEGVLLTSAIVQLMEQYLPDYFGMNKYLGVLLIRYQLGEHDASLVVFGAIPDAVSKKSVRAAAKKAKEKAAAGQELDRPEKVALAKMRWISATDNILLRMGFFFGVIIMKLTYFSGEHLLRFIPFLDEFLKTHLHHTSEEFIQSMRDAYARKPLDIPNNVAVWRQMPGVTEEYRCALVAWRKRIFNALFLGIGLLVLAHLAALGWVISLFRHSSGMTWLCFWVGLGNIIAMWATLSIYLPHVLKERNALERARLEKAC